MMLISSIVDESYIQLGFAGFAFMLIGVIVWMIKDNNKINAESSAALVSVIQGNNEAISGVTVALNAVKESDDQVKYSIEKMDECSKGASRELSKKVDNLREMMLARPCMKKEVL